MVIISPDATVISLLRLADDISVHVLGFNPRAVARNMFLTGPQEPPVALKTSVGVLACITPDVS